MEIIFKGSPNKDNNRKPIDRIVLHWFGVGTLESANSRFQKASEKASAHYGISDNTVWQWVKEEEVAYHAGNYAMNQRSIGIETDGTTSKAHTEHTIQTSIQLVAEICKRYNIPADKDHILRHSDIKATQCPGTLPVERIIAEVNKILHPETLPAWLRGLLNENGINVADAEGRIREIFDQAKKYETAQKERDKALKDLSEAKGMWTQYEEKFITEAKINAKLETEISDLRTKVTDRESTITALRQQIADLGAPVTPQPKKSWLSRLFAFIFGKR